MCARRGNRTQFGFERKSKKKTNKLYFFSFLVFSGFGRDGRRRQKRALKGKEACVEFLFRLVSVWFGVRNKKKIHIAKAGKEGFRFLFFFLVLLFFFIVFSLLGVSTLGQHSRQKWWWPLSQIPPIFLECLIYDNIAIN